MPSSTPCRETLINVSWLGRRDYREMLHAMQAHTRARVAGLRKSAGAAGARDTPGGAGDSPGDALWLVEHPAVFTLGQAADPSHLLDVGTIPVVGSDRGGEVTYHGPGQAVVYVLIELGRYGLKVRALVQMLEQVVIDCLANYGIEGVRRAGAPGVYVGEAKIAALGLRVSRGFSYHGLALNVDMDLAPFSRIDPCGYQGLAITQVADFVPPPGIETCARELAAVCIRHLEGARIAAAVQGEPLGR